MVRTLMGRVNRPKNASTALLASTALASGTLGYGSVTRSGTGATYTTPYGIVTSAPANTPRINNSTLTGTNLLTNPRMVNAIVGSTPNNITNHTMSLVGGATHTVAGTGVLPNGMNYVDFRIYGQMTSTTTLFWQFYPSSLTSTHPIAKQGDVFTMSAYVQVVGGAPPPSAGVAPIVLGMDERTSGAHVNYNFTATGQVGTLSTDMTRIMRTMTVGAAGITEVQPGIWFSCSNGQWFLDLTLRIAGVQFELGSTATAMSYPPPGTLGPSANYVQPRLLVEESRTNGIRNPRLEGGSAITNAVDAGYTNAPTNMGFGGGMVGSGLATDTSFGTEFGMPYWQVRFYGTTAGNGHTAYFETNSGMAAVANTMYSMSAYVRLVGGALPAGCTVATGFIEYNSGVSGAGPNGGSITPTAALQRVVYSVSTSAGPLTHIRQTLGIGGYASGVAVDFTLRMYGPQCEQGAFATSLILPPAGSPAVTTRFPDDIVIPTTGRVQFAASVTNTLLYGGDLNPLGWSVANAPTITTGQASPDGGTSAIEILTNSAANEGKYTFPATVVGRYYTQSVYLKNVSGATNVVVGNDFAPGATISCDLTTGNINARATSTISGNLVGMGNGWYRASVTFLATATSTSFIVYGIGGIGQRFLVWGAQHEVAPVTPSQNLLVAPEDLYFSSWTKAGATILPNSIAAPDGTLTADRIVEDTSTGSHGVWQAYVIPTPGQYTIKFYAKASERTQILMKGYNSTDGNAMAVWVDLSNGTTFYNSQGVVSVTAVGGGWYRITCTATFSAVYTQWFIVAASGGTDNYAGSTSAGLYVWGVQLSRGGVIDYVAANQLTSPQIYTVATAATRTRLASGTIVAKVKVPTAGPTNPSGIVAFTDGTSGLRAGLRFNLGNNNLTLFSFGSVNQANSVQLGSIPAAGTVITVAFAWSNGSMAAAYGGQYMSLGQPPQLGMVDMRLGSSSVPGQYLNSELESVVYYPYRMSYQQLLTVTS